MIKCENCDKNTFDCECDDECPICEKDWDYCLCDDVERDWRGFVEEQYRIAILS